MRKDYRYGKKIQQLRQTRAWTQEQLAMSADVDARTIQRVEKDRTQNPETLQAIAGAFNVDLAELRATFLISESRLLRTKLITTYQQFVRAEETNKPQVAVRVIMVPLKDEFEDQVKDLWEQVFVDRDVIEPDDPDLWKYYVGAIKEPLEDLLGFGFAIFIIDERKDLILPQVGDLQPIKEYIDDWRVRHYMLIPKHGCFQLRTGTLMHRFNSTCSVASEALFSLSKKQEAGAFVYPNALPAIFRAGAESSIQRCDACFPKSADGTRITLDYIQEVTGLTRAELHFAYEEFTDERFLQGLS